MQTYAWRERIAAALERIADSMDAAKVLEERRAKDRNRKRSVGRHSAEFPRKERNANQTGKRSLSASSRNW